MKVFPSAISFAIGTGVLLSLSGATGFPTPWLVVTRQHRNTSTARGDRNDHGRFWVSVRGGARDHTRRRDVAKDSSHSVSTEERFHQGGMSLALASSYFAVMGAKCVLPSVLSLLVSPSTTGMTFSPTSTPQSQMASLLRISTVAVATGKLLLGPAIDYLGGIRSLQICLVVLVGLLALISSLQQFRHFALAWILVDFVFSACWAASLNSIHQSFEEKDWGRQIGRLAMGARTGNAASFSLFAAILYALNETRKQPWREVFLASAILQVIPLGLLTYFGSKTLQTSKLTERKNQNAMPSSTPLQILLKEARCAPEFWLHLVSRSCLMIFASFLLFVPTLMSQVYGVSTSVAAQVASIYSLGCLLSVSLGSRIYSSLSKSKQVMAIVALLLLATVSSLIQLAHVSGFTQISVAAAAASMFTWGVAFSIPFYLPPSLYALERGGRTGSATISDAFDFLGFALLAFFNGYVASIHPTDMSSWVGCFQITTICSVVSLIAQPLAVFLQ